MADCRRKNFKVTPADLETAGRMISGERPWTSHAEFAAAVADQAVKLAKARALDVAGHSCGFPRQSRAGRSH